MRNFLPLNFNSYEELLTPSQSTQASLFLKVVLLTSRPLDIKTKLNDFLILPVSFSS